MKTLANKLNKFSLFTMVSVLALSCSSDDDSGKVLPPTSGPEPTEMVTPLPDPDANGIINASITSSENERTFMLHLPESYTEDTTMPVVFNLHGIQGTAEGHEDYTQFNAASETYNFIAVHPQGLEANTFAGFVPQWDTEFSTRTMDVEFIDDLIDYLDEVLNIDLSRIYVTGYSNGGFMAFKLACELSDRIAAIAPIAANIPWNQQNFCDQVHQTPILMIHGTLDNAVPVGGNGFFNSTQGSIEFFSTKYGCDATATMTDLMDTDPSDESTVKQFTYTNCSDGAPLTYYQVIGGGHTWPGTEPLFPQLGATNQDIDANEVIWEFFSTITHPNPRQ